MILKKKIKHVQLSWALTYNKKNSEYVDVPITEKKYTQ